MKENPVLPEEKKLQHRLFWTILLIFSHFIRSLVHSVSCQKNCEVVLREINYEFLAEIFRF